MCGELRPCQSSEKYSEYNVFFAPHDYQSMNLEMTPLPRSSMITHWFHEAKLLGLHNHPAKRIYATRSICDDRVELAQKRLALRDNVRRLDLDLVQVGWAHANDDARGRYVAGIVCPSAIGHLDAAVDHGNREPEIIHGPFGKCAPAVNHTVIMIVGHIWRGEL